MQLKQYAAMLLLLAVLLIPVGCGNPGPSGGGVPASVPVVESVPLTVPPEQTEPAASETNAVSAESEIVPGQTKAVPEETEPEETLPPARVFSEEDFHFCDGRTGDRLEGKINVAFYPDQLGADGQPDPNIRVWDSCEITHPEEIRAICERILASPLYDPDIYGRTLDSMVTEWQAHNDVHAVFPNERTRHADFNRADEGLSYADFWQRAARDYLDSRRP